MADTLERLEDALNDAARELRKAEDAAVKQVQLRKERNSLYTGAEQKTTEELRAKFPMLPGGN